ncbi:hypothetical protein ABTM76_19305, partial [Acinetobacter baumannii]
SLLKGYDTAYKFSFWKDANFTKPITVPSQIDSSGIYYILIKDKQGCVTNIAISATIVTPNSFSVNNQTACAFVNLTSPNVINSNPGDFTFDY